MLVFKRQRGSIIGILTVALAAPRRKRRPARRIPIPARTYPLVERHG